MDERAYWIAFNCVAGIGPARLTALMDLCGSIESAWNAPVQHLEAAGLDRRAIDNLVAVRQELDPQRELEKVARRGFDVRTQEDAGYPANLLHLPNSPPLLYVRGHLEQQDRLAVAVVGTRRVSAYGREVARKIGSELGLNGVTVVSGLALGVDAIAHAAALESGGRTIAVLGSGVDQIYPARNRKLALQIIENGALISEYPIGTKPEARNFPPRNRIISGMSLAVVVVEAAARSGALITASFAADQGRDVYAVPGSILSPGSDGCNRLIQDGAIPVTSPGDLLERLQLDTAAAQQQARDSIPATPQEELILRHVTAEPQHMNEIVRAATMDTSRVSGLLATMEIKGLVRHVGLMQYVRAV